MQTAWMAENKDAEIRLVVETFSPPAMLYRRACAQAQQAVRMADEFSETGRHERRLREMDASMTTIVLAQASAESWIYSAYRRAAVEPLGKGGWRQRWVDAPRLICGEGTRGLDASTERSLRTLGTWRNFLLHGDDASRRRLHSIVPEEDVADRLTSELARMVIEQMDASFADAGALLGVHGTAGLHSAFLWVAPDET